MIAKKHLRAMAEALAEEISEQQAHPEDSKKDRKVVLVEAVSREEFDRECPPIDQHTDLITDELKFGGHSEAHEIEHRRSTKAVTRLARATDDMLNALNRQITWLAQRVDATPILTYMAEIGDRAHETRDEAETHEAVWPNDHMRRRWRSAVRQVREFNRIRDQIAAQL